MKKVTIHQAKTNLSKLLVSVEGGEEVIIARGGIAVAKLSRVKNENSVKQLGRYRGKFVVSEQFDAPLPKSIQKHFQK
jgi:antitoxin (DNA-binding transcriptional repressor) of toxin-antitoxin stability system